MTNTNALTQSILRYLNYNNAKAWRTNNGAVYDARRECYRKNHSSLLGVPDIVGYFKFTGQALFVEVKTGKDKLSVYQENFIEDAKRHCFVCVARSFDQFEKEFNDFIKSKI